LSGVGGQPKIRPTKNIMFKEPFSFAGRIRRSELWIGAIIFFFGIGIVAGLASSSDILALALFP
jgi:uncharacterized membrane protein YhaH (DUF805 family)